MKYCRIIFLLMLVLFAVCSKAQQTTVYTYQDFKRAKGISLVRNEQVSGLSKKQNVEDAYPISAADAWVEIRVNQPGTYILDAVVEVIDEAQLRASDKSGKLTKYGFLQLGSGKITKRILFDQYKAGKQELGKFEFHNKKETLKIWLPNNILFKELSVKPYQAPIAPADAIVYQPQVKPNASHPRLWVNSETLPVVQKRLLSEENQEAWARVSVTAKEAYRFPYANQHEIFHDEKLEQVIEEKAFYYLMTKDAVVGKEAISLVTEYFARLEFGNVTYGDITRELGRAIYRGALVYDWCYDLLSKEQKDVLRTEMMRLVQDMEIGWPPFYGLESIINGHGNEAQICRDMLAWSLAIFDEDPEPYRYVSYTILEQLVPMRKFEYQSPRHNQGVDYGGYRFGWEMHAVWLYYRMLGYSVFDDNIKNMSDYWLYMRTPDGKMLRDGDMFNVKYSSSDEFYWKNPQTMLLCYAFNGDPMIKAEFFKQGALPENPVLYLLLNDPTLKAADDRSKLPLTKDFGPILGSMIARTGWSEDKASGDVVAEIKGAGYHFGNHQHADAGALQIYYHGIQVGDLGLYLSYGSPYDFNFNKRSISHSMMLLRDPSEPLLFRTKTNDGGTRFSQRFPKTKAEVLGDSWFQTGKTLASAFGPDPIRPSFSYYSMDLTAAYTSKVQSYAKNFLFLNLEREDVPAAIFVIDEMKAANKDFEAYWQINTLTAPEVLANGVRLTSRFKGKGGHADVELISPSKDNRRLKLLSGDSSAYVFGDKYQVNSPWPEAKGTRVMVESLNKEGEHNFAALYQLYEEGHAKLPTQVREFANYYQLSIADKLVIIGKPGRYLREEIGFEIPGDKLYEVILLGMSDGFWNLQNSDKNTSFNIRVQPNEHAFSWKQQGGKILLRPGRQYGAAEGNLKSHNNK
ncbi:hypothetical protein [Sphingobacteruim zhuxiongii]|uniref:hypothetical protein n=1 Tax=Sphingobacterium zhuxiongii TaxID=2662364 RepID=UPI001920C5F9|nr:hypothetical protein [Sphingobacterium sp. DK4209]